MAKKVNQTNKRPFCGKIPFIFYVGVVLRVYFYALLLCCFTYLYPYFICHSLMYFTVIYFTVAVFLLVVFPKIICLLFCVAV